MAGGPAAREGRLVENIVHFARALRKAGIPAGPGQVRTAIEAVGRAGFTRRRDFYFALRATLVTRPEHLQTFHQVFHFFWRDPEYLERMLKMMLPLAQAIGGEEDQVPEPGERRAAEALADAAGRPPRAPERRKVELDAEMTFSPNEVLRKMDFEQMSAAEIRQAARAIRDMRLPIEPLRTRRHVAAPTGPAPDARAILRRALRRGGEIDRLSLKRPRRRPPDLVVLCDISGSMSVYSRMMMHFVHALIRAERPAWGRISAFTFGTRLTNVSRALHLKDVDQALAAAGRDAPDWQGGTRIGDALGQFNRQWSRRVLGRGAVVLLITDGLERGAIEQLRAEAGRLARSCRRLIWLNPLLRWDGFAPDAGGVRALLPLVDSFHACHSLDSLADLGATLSGGCEKRRLAAMIGQPRR